MAKLQPITNAQDNLVGYAFYCPGCKFVHQVAVNSKNELTGASWGFNGNQAAPTFTPSVLVRYRHPKGYSNDDPAPKGWEGELVEDICHSFVTDGNIQFLADCTHGLAGQTITLPEFRWDDEDDI